MLLTSWALFSWESAKIVISSANRRLAMVTPSTSTPFGLSLAEVVYKDKKKDSCKYASLKDSNVDRKFPRVPMVCSNKS